MELHSRPAGFAEHAALSAGAQDRAFGLTHRACESEEQPIVAGRRVIAAIFVEHQGPGEGADFAPVRPIARAPGQAGDLQAQDKADLAQADLRDEALKASPVSR
jgi:hypothetical protein